MLTKTYHYTENFDLVRISTISILVELTKNPKLTLNERIIKTYLENDTYTHKYYPYKQTINMNILHTTQRHIIELKKNSLLIFTI